MDKVNINFSFPGFFGLLTLLFIGLKLGNVIDWSWWAVLSPLLFILGCVGLALAIVLWMVFDGR